ncbi:DUF7380 domain-containing protein [Duffyella gerundensis]|uniref:DUF7380 domain-containing protein n=1 Tax=Duffyella gerundensis TaxID=1619313 RepID=UPI001654788F|nr:hypothetical protein [Duffyella gerundensis]
MSDLEEREGEDNKKSLEKASADDLRAASLNQVLSCYKHIDETGMALELYKKAEQAFDAGNIPAYRGLRILEALCWFHMRTDDPADTWHPRWSDGEGRALTPADVRGEQNLELAEIVTQITHPGLRARVADVVWSNDRKQHKAAREAINAYCECVDGLMNGTFIEKDKGELRSSFEISNLIQRALFINASIGKKNPVPDNLKDTFINFYNYARDSILYVVFSRIGELAAGYKILSWQAVAKDSELLLDSGHDSDYPEARKKVWALAARCYETINDKEGRRRCLGRSVDETLKMCDQVSNYAAKAAWMRQAISELRIAGGFRDRVKKIIEDMRIAQFTSLDEFSEYKTPLDVEHQFKKTCKTFSKLTIPDVLFNFAIVAESPSIELLKEITYEERPSGLFSILFPQSRYHDREGKVIGKTLGSVGADGPDENWYKENSLNPMNHMRHNIVEGVIKPARYTVMHNYPIESRHFDAIVSHSPFVPFGHEHIFSLGFARFWQGDFASAVFLLIPQLENSLRLLLMNSGRDTFKTEKEEVQEDRSLSGIIQNKRDDLESVLGEDIVNEIDLLFNFKLGPCLRHKLAHGKLTAGDCYSVECIYACWFIYRLTCIPLLPYWKSHVAPQINLAI